MNRARSIPIYSFGGYPFIDNIEYNELLDSFIFNSLVVKMAAASG